MRKDIRWFLLVAVALAMESSAGAANTGGTKVGRDVTIGNTDPGLPDLWIASGALGSARFDAPTAPAVAKEIGCRLQPTLTGTLVNCWAYVPTGSQQNLVCSSNDPTLVAVVGALNGDSMLEFSTFLKSPNAWGLPAGTCGSIAVENASKYFPKTP